MPARAKDTEVRSVEEFAARGAFASPVVDIRRCDPPACDFELVFKNGEIVGVEVTDVADEMRARGHAIADTVSDELRVALLAAGASKCIVGLSFAGGYSLAPTKRRDRARLVSALVSLIIGHRKDDRPAQWYERERPPGFRRKRAAPELQAVALLPLSAVYVGPSKQVSVYHSTHAHGHRWPIVQSAIDPKNERIAGYRSAMPGRSIWLLLVNGFRPLSGVPREVVEGHTFASAFDRTFCLDCFSGEVYAVPTAAPGIV